MSGTTNGLDYARLKQLLSNQTVTNSVDNRVVVRFRDLAHVPKAKKSELYVPNYVQFLYP